MRVDLIEMRKSVWQLGQDHGGRAAIHLAHVIAFEGVHEALGDSVRLRAANGRMHWRNAEISCNFVGVVRKMYNWAKAAGYVPYEMPNPGVGIVRFPTKRRRRFVTAAEMPRLLESVEAEDNEMARHAVWLLLLAGIRKSHLQQRIQKNLFGRRSRLFRRAVHANFQRIHL